MTITTTTAASKDDNHSQQQPPVVIAEPFASSSSSTATAPLASSVAVAPSAGGATSTLISVRNTSSGDIVVVDVPPGIVGQDIVFTGTPNPIVQYINPNKVCSDDIISKQIEGKYCSSLKLGNNINDNTAITISNIDNSEQLNTIIESNHGLHRQLFLSSSVPAKMVANDENGLIYRFYIPDNCTNLGIQMKGFPPIISAIDEKNSPFVNQIHIGHIVHSIEIPGYPISNLQSGGFTAMNVMKKLTDHIHIPNKYISVQDRRIIRPTEKGSNDAFDFGGFNTFWGTKVFQNMFKSSSSKKMNTKNKNDNNSSSAIMKK